ncbi:MAG: outer membrane protein assembly factor BamD [Desulfobulbaceae bacterium]|nr:outer membrane protein assembly factor BamD [Desulfobulbaceae bacterium]
MLWNRCTHILSQQWTSYLLVLCCSLLLLQGCATSQPKQISEDSAAKVQKILNKAMGNFKEGQYRTALEGFENIIDNYPFDRQAIVAELKAADCHYYLSNYVEAKVMYQQFEERHPYNEATSYAMFQSGMCDIRQTDRIDRNVSGAEDAVKSFNRLLRTYPDSPYTKEAEARVKAAKEFLINHELFVAVFYIRTKRYGEAIHRLKYINRVYPEARIKDKVKSLLTRLEAGDPPKLGINKWLPDFEMPDWHLFHKTTSDE